MIEAKTGSPLSLSTNNAGGGGGGGDKPKQVPSATLYAAAASALLGAGGMGLVIGWSSPAIESLKKGEAGLRITDTHQQSWIGSTMTLGALVGALISGWLCQTLGRKKALIFIGIPYTIGWVLLGLSTSYETLILGRVILGLSTGLVSGTAPVYVKEVCTLSTQGVVGTGFQIFMVLGILTAFVLGTFLNWQVLSFLCAIPTLAMSILMLGMPESPSWLMSRSYRDAAGRSLRRLRGEGSESNKELDAIESELKSQPKFSMQALCAAYGTYGHFMPCLLAILLQILQQICGINAVMFYSSDIFANSGVTIEPNYCSIILAVVQVVFTLCCSFLITRIGRKMLLYISSLLHMFSLTALGFHYYLNRDRAKTERDTDTGFIPVICLVVFIIGFSLGWGPIPWLMIPEFTPSMSRSATSALATAVNWTFAFIVSKFFVNLVDSIHQHGAFFLFSFSSLVGMFFVLFMLAETKDKDAATMAKLFKRGKGDPERTSSVEKSGKHTSLGTGSKTE